MTRNTKFIALPLFGLIAGVLAATSCGRTVDQACYPKLAAPDFPPGTLPHDLPVCTWAPTELPEPPDGYVLRYFTFATFSPSDDGSCDACDVERLDALLETSIGSRMAQGSPSCARMDPSEIVRGCVHPPDDDNDQCTVVGAYFSNYKNVPVEHGCIDCSVPGACGGGVSPTEEDET